MCFVCVCCRSDDDHNGEVAEDGVIAQSNPLTSGKGGGGGCTLERTLFGRDDDDEKGQRKPFSQANDGKIF